MKIAIITEGYRPFINGVIVSIDLFAKQFRKLGHEVYIFAPSYPDYKEDEEYIFRLGSVPSIIQKSIRIPVPTYIKMDKLFSKIGFDIIHIQHPIIFGQVVKRLVKKYKLPLVFTHHSFYENYSHYIPLPQKFIKKMAIKLSVDFSNNCDLVVTPSETVKEVLRTRGVIAPIEVIPTGINFKMFNKASGDFVREKYQISKESKILLFVGRMSKEKNLDILLDSFPMVISDFPDTYLILVGEGPERKKMEKKVKEIGVNDKVLFIDSQPYNEIPNFYKESDLFLFPSKKDTQGLVVLEAMTCALPIVAVRSMCVEELNIDKRAGFLTRNSPIEFSKKIRKLLADKNIYNEFSKNSVEIAKKYSYEDSASLLIDKFKDLISCKKS